MNLNTTFAVSAVQATLCAGFPSVAVIFKALDRLQPFHVEAEAVIRARLERAFKERIRRLEQQHAERIDQLK